MVHLIRLLIAAVILSPSAAIGADLDPAILLELAKAKRIREANPVKMTKTMCGCGKTGNCTCWASECSCPACGLGGAAAPGKASPGTPARPQSQNSGSSRTVVSSTVVTIQRTPALKTVTPVLKAPELGSSDLSSGTDSIRINAPYALRPGGIDGGCANGQCPTSRSGGFFRRR